VIAKFVEVALPETVRPPAAVPLRSLLTRVRGSAGEERCGRRSGRVVISYNAACSDDRQCCVWRGGTDADIAREVGGAVVEQAEYGGRCGVEEFHELTGAGARPGDGEARPRVVVVPIDTRVFCGAELAPSFSPYTVNTGVVADEYRLRFDSTGRRTRRKREIRERDNTRVGVEVQVTDGKIR